MYALTLAPAHIRKWSNSADMQEATFSVNWWREEWERLQSEAFAVLDQVENATGLLEQSQRQLPKALSDRDLAQARVNRTTDPIALADAERTLAEMESVTDNLLAQINELPVTIRELQAQADALWDKAEEAEKNHYAWVTYRANLHSDEVAAGISAA